MQIINTALFFPMFSMVVLTTVVMTISFYLRVTAVRSGKMDVRHFKTYTLGEPTEAVAKSGRHFINLFEVPVLFYIGCLAAMIVPVGGFWIQFWAWLFVCARVVHAYIHMGKNKIPARMAAFGLGWLAILGLWTRLFLHLI